MRRCQSFCFIGPLCFAVSTMNLPLGAAIFLAARRFYRTQDIMREVCADSGYDEGEDRDHEDDEEEGEERRRFLAEAGEVFEELVVPRPIDEGGVDLVSLVPVKDGERGQIIIVIEPFGSSMVAAHVLVVDLAHLAIVGEGGRRMFLYQGPS